MEQACQSRWKIWAGPILALSRVVMLSPRAWAPRTASFSEKRPSDWISGIKLAVGQQLIQATETKQDALLNLATDPLVVHDEQISPGTIGLRANGTDRRSCGHYHRHKRLQRTRTLLDYLQFGVTLGFPALDGYRALCGINQLPPLCVAKCRR